MSLLRWWTARDGRTARASNTRPVRARACRPWLGLALLATIGAPCSAALGEEDKQPEYRVKAAFLFNLAKFVDWPQTAFGDKQAPFVIGVLGDDPFGAELDTTIARKTVSGRAVVVERYREVKDIQRCQILFISQSERPRLDQVMEALRASPILTVSELPQFLRSGGMILLRLEDNRISFEAGADAARKVGLTMSSKLLKLAKNGDQ